MNSSLPSACSRTPPCRPPAFRLEDRRQPLVGPQRQSLAATFADLNRGASQPRLEDEIVPAFDRLQDLVYLLTEAGWRAAQEAKDSHTE